MENDDEESQAVVTKVPSRSWYTNLWHRETIENVFWGSDSDINNESHEQDERDISKNGALMEFRPALTQRIELTRRRHRDLHNKHSDILATVLNLMQHFKPDPAQRIVDATAGAVGWIVYLFRTPGETPVWKTCHSEVRIATLLHDPNCLVDDFQRWKQQEGVTQYERRWIHLPANNMEWVELLMHRIVETFVSKNEAISFSNLTEATNHVVRHILHPVRWGARQNDRSPYMLHARSMVPLTQQFTVASKSSSPEFAALSKRSFVLFMPYLSWERSTVAMYRNIVYRHARKKAESLTKYKDGRIQVPSHVAAASTAEIPCCEREALLRNYLFAQKPLHLRRTLDQSYYTMTSDTTRRDEDQVAERHAQAQTHWNLRDRLDPCILMVDHLWLWALNQDTVVTCFPKPWSHQADLVHSDLFTFMRERMVQKLNAREAKPGKTRIGRLITEACARYINKLHKASQCHQFKRFFEQALRKVEDDKSFIYRDMSDDLRADKPEGNVNFLDITKKFKALGELMDIMDEIHMILNVIEQQIDLLTKFDARLVKTRVDNKGDPWTDWRIIGKLRDEKASWEKILARANVTRDEIRDLLELMQQHATIKLATDTSHQSNAIMLFTMVTILFLPLSTLAALFGVNASNFGQGDIPLSTILACIFLISLVIILFVVILVVNQTLRRCVTLSLEIIIAHFKFFLPYGILDHSADRLAGYLAKLQNVRQDTVSRHLEKKKRKEHEEKTRKRIEEEKAAQRRASVQHQTIQPLSKSSTVEDDEFEVDSNVDIDEDDKTSTSAGTNMDSKERS